MNWMMALLLMALAQEGRKVAPPDRAKSIPALPRVEAERCSDLVGFGFGLSSSDRATSVGNRLYETGRKGVFINSLELDSLDVRTEFLLGEFVDPKDPDDELRILARMGNLGAAYHKFLSKGWLWHPPERVMLKDLQLKWEYDTFKSRLDRLEQDYPPKYHLNQILQEIHDLPEAQQKERRREWQHKLFADAYVTTGGGGGLEDMGMVGPDGRFMWRGTKPNFDEVFGIGNVLTHTMAPHALREAWRPSKEQGQERIRPACAQIISADGRWGFQNHGTLAFYDMKAMKLAWTKDRKWITHGAAFSPDGRRCLVHGRGPIWIFDMEKKRIEQELWIEGPDAAFWKKAPSVRGLSDDGYAEFSPRGRYFVLVEGDLKEKYVGFYDLQSEATMGAIPRAERAFRGWGPLEHTAFFMDSENRMVLRDIRDGERLLELAAPGHLDMRRHSVNRLLCPPNHEGMVLASLTDLHPPMPPGPPRMDAAPRLSGRVARWNLKPQMETLKKRLEAKAIAK